MLNISRKCTTRVLKRTLILCQRELAGDPNKERSPFLKRIREEFEADKQALSWRKTPPQVDGFESKLKLFGNDDQTSDYIVMMQKPMDISSWLLAKKNKKEKQERYMQQFVPERHNILGSDLASAHFVLYRRGAVKFLNMPGWIRANEDGEFNLPSKFDPQFKVEGLKCDNMTLYYEGLDNIRWLQHLKFLSFHNVGTFDDWCLDRVSGSQFDKIEVLDISGTKCTYRGLSCLYRLNSLKLLIVDDVKESIEFELSCSMLQEVLLNLKINSASAVHV
ncbi:distal membrane-arm assembly complex protein 2 [Glossina fuscipes]|uniref:Distal membrane-arm assembly complex protein 2 n=1 Tax=Glossina fuscipes TaxID=7396 RepID=A0A8U0W2W9_9MUSC|nr:distal membrane-arm assembly complex protein 2 [Glossina fuscipes]